MKSLIIAVALLGSTIPAMAETSININIGQPDFFGRIDLGDMRRPPVVYAQPMIIEQRVRRVAEPVYLRVPPGHMKNWGKHCSRYDACGQRVYFVRDDWYNNTYAPRYRDRQEGRTVRVSERVYEDQYSNRQERGHDGHDDKHDKHDKHKNKHKDKHKDKGHGHGKH